MQIGFHGATQEVGRAAILVEEGKHRVLLDYGVKINEETHLPLPVQGFVDGIIATHAHLDHVGAIPMLYKLTEIPCWMTPPTLPTMELLVKDSIKVQHLKGLEAIFSASHLKRLIRSVIPVEYKKKARVGEFEFEFRDAGHILGAASVEMQSKKHSLVYTGDIKLEPTRLHDGADIGFKEADVLITESTYGGSEHPHRKEIEKQFVDACNEVLGRDGNVLVPAFAVGRAQELVTILHAHKFSYPVYMDGMAKQAAEIMFDFPKYVRDFNEMYSALKAATWAEDEIDRRAALSGPSVIVSPAGNLQGGHSVRYLMKLREKRESAVFFSGYQPAESPGRELLETKRLKYEGYDLDYKKHRIEHFDFSAHASASELHKIVKKVNPKVVCVVHGEPKPAKALGDWITENTGAYVKVPKFGDKIDVEKHM
jgi:putative mRNA 3-end processing factor